MMARRKRKLIHEKEDPSANVDRFTQSERNSLLDAYDKLGFQVFQDMHLLRQFLPDRTENDLRGLISRLKVGLQQDATSNMNEDKIGDLDEWLRLCQSLMGNFAKDKRVNMDDVLADALMIVAQEREHAEMQEQQHNDPDKPNYPELLRSFSQLLAGKFPNNMTPANARISSKLFDHITDLADSMNLDQIGPIIESGSWLQSSADERRRRQKMALMGLDELERGMKKSPSLRDMNSENIEALCLELPKIQRITELLNPLSINKMLLNSLTCHHNHIGDQ